MSYRNPTPTVDIIIEVSNGIVLIERKHEPLGWALPGGFVDYGESVEAAAIREALEETMLAVSLTDLLYVYSNPARDQRQHTMSTVFVGVASGVPRAADDAKDVRVVDPSDLPDVLCFDHRRILSDYVEFKRSGRRPLPGGDR
jgi:8-oxo-dGTP diphosphatase